MIHEIGRMTISSGDDAELGDVDISIEDCAQWNIAECGFSIDDIEEIITELEAVVFYYKKEQENGQQ